MSAWSEFTSFITTADNWWGDNGIANRFAEHLRVSIAAVGAAAAVTIPAAAFLGHVRRGGVLVQWVVNVGRAVPSLAILSLLFPLALKYGFGLGFWPTLAALVLLAIPPIFSNAYAGVRDVDPSIVEASRGMGMRPSEVLWRVEVPTSLSFILTGVRVATLQVIATATLGTYVGFNCLGSFINEGIRQQDDGKLLTGAVAVALTALLVDLAFGFLIRRVTPWVKSRRQLRRVDPRIMTPELLPTKGSMP